MTLDPGFTLCTTDFSAAICYENEALIVIQEHPCNDPDAVRAAKDLQGQQNSAQYQIIFVDKYSQAFSTSFLFWKLKRYVEVKVMMKSLQACDLQRLSFFNEDKR